MEKLKCTFCDLPMEARLIQMQLKDERSDRNVIRMLWFGFGFITPLVFYMCSCTSGHFVTKFRITDSENRSYYTNVFTIKNDSIFFIENPRNLNGIRNFSIPFRNIKIDETNSEH